MCGLVQCCRRYQLNSLCVNTLSLRQQSLTRRYCKESSKKDLVLRYQNNEIHTNNSGKIIVMLPIKHSLLLKREGSALWGIELEASIFVVPQPNRNESLVAVPNIG